MAELMPPPRGRDAQQPSMELMDPSTLYKSFKSKPNLAAQQEEEMRAGREESEMQLAILKQEVNELTRKVTEEMSGKVPPPGTQERDNPPKEAATKIRQLELKVNSQRKKYDIMRSSISLKEKQLDEMQDVLDELVATNHHLEVGREVQGIANPAGRTPSPAPQEVVPGNNDQLVASEKSMHAPSLKLNPSAEDLARHLRELANRCEKAILKQYEAEAVGKTYHQILTRLSNMQRELVPQQEALRARVQGKEDELAMEAEQLASAEHAQQRTKKESAHLREAQLASAHSWETRLEQLRAVVETEEGVKKRAAERIQMRLELQQRLAGDMSAAEEDANKRKLIGDLAGDVAGDLARENDHDLLRVEEAFLKIREITGIESLDEVVEKLTTSQTLSRRLKAAVSEGQAAVTKHTAVLKESRKELDDLQYTSSSLNNSRRQVDEVDEKLASADKSLSKTLGSCGQVEQVLMNASIGMQAIATLLQAVPLEGPAPEADSQEEQLLLSCLQKHERLLEGVRRHREENNEPTAGLEGGELMEEHAPLNPEEERIASGQLAEAKVMHVRSRWLEREDSADGKPRMRISDLLDASDEELNGSDDDDEDDDDVRDRDEIKKDSVLKREIEQLGEEGGDMAGARDKKGGGRAKAGDQKAAQKARRRSTSSKPK